MEFRTTVNVKPSETAISYLDPVMFVGSCFAASIGKKMETGHMPVMINPSGTVYNPVSVHDTIKNIVDGKEFKTDDLINFNGTWLSFYHYTSFNSENAEEVLNLININTKKAQVFMAGAKVLFITFGTARVYRWKKSGAIVSNCHKIPASEFEQELLPVDKIVRLWEGLLDILHKSYPALKVIFTISPVRHWKDGAHGNQVSKSVLFMAVEELLSHPSCGGYFPAYELLMDDLRDYRFYDHDMVHPAPVAVDYIWDKFAECFIDSETMSLWHEIVKISKACDHHISKGSPVAINKFAQKMLQQILAVKLKNPVLDMSAEENYFLNLLNETKKYRQ